MLCACLASVSKRAVGLLPKQQEMFDAMGCLLFTVFCQQSSAANKLYCPVQVCAGNPPLAPQVLLAAHLQPTWLELTLADLPADLQLHRHGNNCRQHHCLGINGVW